MEYMEDSNDSELVILVTEAVFPPPFGDINNIKYQQERLENVI